MLKNWSMEMGGEYFTVSRSKSKSEITTFLSLTWLGQPRSSMYFITMVEVLNNSLRTSATIGAGTPFFTSSKSSTRTMPSLFKLRSSFSKKC